MQNHMLVLPGHLNHYGFLFGGHLLKWIDESAWIAATLDYPGCSLVTVAMERVEFKRSVQQGTILTCSITRLRQGTTSVQYAVSVTRPGPEGKPEEIFSNTVTLVRVDEQGRKLAL